MADDEDKRSLAGRIAGSIPGLRLLVSLSADRLIAAIVIGAGILLGVWMFGR
jgi:hypothetical protein